MEEKGDMNKNTGQLSEAYAEWIKKESSTHDAGKWREISIPMLDYSNDEIAFYVKNNENDVSFSDDGFTVEAFYMNGLNFTKARKEQLEQIVRPFGAHLDANENIVLNDSNNRSDAFVRYAQALIQAQILLSRHVK